MEWQIFDSSGAILCEKSYTSDGNDSSQIIRNSVVAETCCFIPEEMYTIKCNSLNPSGVDGYGYGWDFDDYEFPNWKNVDNP